MKTLGALLLLFIATTAFSADPAPIPRTQINQVLGASKDASGGGTLIPIVQLGTGEPRQFELHIKTVMADGATAFGTFQENGKRVQAGQIFVRGLPAGTVDGLRLSTWLEREGVQTFQRGEAKTTTVASYRVIPEPANIPAPAAVKKDPLSTFGKTPLDQRPER